jgi:hypothetical protein
MLDYCPLSLGVRREARPDHVANTTPTRASRVRSSMKGMMTTRLSLGEKTRHWQNHFPWASTSERA